MKAFLSNSESLRNCLNTILTSIEDDNEVEIFSKPSDTVDYKNIRIKSGSVTTRLRGECVWETMIDAGFIFMTDQANSNKGLIISFNFVNPPTKTTTYKIVENGFGESPNHIDIVFSEYRIVNARTGILQWISTDQSGELTLVVSGNKITANLDGIVLRPRLDSAGFNSLNVGDYAKLGRLSGSLTMEL